MLTRPKFAKEAAQFINSLGLIEEFRSANFVLVIYLDEKTSVCNERHYRPHLEFWHFSLILHTTAAGVLQPSCYDSGSVY